MRGALVADEWSARDGRHRLDEVAGEVRALVAAHPGPETKVCGGTCQGAHPASSVTHHIPLSGTRREDDRVEAACTWSDFRKDYGTSADNKTRLVEHRAFLAG